MDQLIQKKLDEIEYELKAVFHLPPETSPNDPRRDITFDDVKQKFDFLRRLLKAESSSQPPQNADQLHQAEQRLTQLEAAFRKWNASRFSTPPDVDNLDETASYSDELDGTAERLTAPEAAFRQSRVSARDKYNIDDALSVCSDCFSQRNLYDDVEESDSDVSETESFVSPEKKVVVGGGGKDVEKEERKTWGNMCKRWGVFGSGMIVGALICMGMRYFTCFELGSEYYEQVYVFPPPT